MWFLHKIRHNPLFIAILTQIKFTYKYETKVIKTLLQLKSKLLNTKTLKVFLQFSSLHYPATADWTRNFFLSYLVCENSWVIHWFFILFTVVNLINHNLVPKEALLSAWRCFYHWLNQLLPFSATHQLTTLFHFLLLLLRTQVWRFELHCINGVDMAPSELSFIHTILPGLLSCSISPNFRL